MSHVVVVGGGFAGVAAAVAAREAGAQVTLWCGRGGASSFAPGAFDELPWDELEAAARLVGAELVAAPLPAGVRSLLEALEHVQIVPDGAPLARLSTTVGVVRTTRAHDRALLDLTAIRGRTLLVPRADRANWDADALARALAESAHVTAVEVVDCPVLRYDEETRISDAELAERHDDPARIDWLCRGLRREVERRTATSCAVLLGPWLGRRASRDAELSQLVGAPVGETMSALAGTAGLRFEFARERLLSREGVRVLSGEVASVRSTGRALEVAGGAELVTASSVVLAMGGLVGGGIVYDPPEHGAGAEGSDRLGPPFRLAIDVSGAKVSATREHGLAGSIEGPVLDCSAWPAAGRAGLLERVGVHVAASGEVVPGIFAAGDITFGGRRTALAALASGLAAGQAAAHSGSVLERGRL